MNQIRSYWSDIREGIHSTGRGIKRDLEKANNRNDLLDLYFQEFKERLNNRE
jgi:hypothetical protein